MPPRTLEELIARYLRLNEKRPRSRTADEEASLAYLREELAQSAGSSTATGSRNLALGR